MKITADKIERLVFVKYLLTQAEISKDLDRPISSTTILTLHDAVECFLQLSYEQLTGKAKLTGNQILDNYSDKINEVLLLENKPQINKSFIKRINELRNQLKHATIFIDKKNIQNLFSETDLFFNDFTQIFFNLNFHELSLTSLISNEEIQKHLLGAEKEIKNKEFQKAMFLIGKAFYELEAIGTKVEGRYGENILSKHHIIDYLIKYRAQFGGDEPDNVLRENLKEIAEDINRIQDDLHDLKKVVSLSADLKKYKKFRTNIPFVTKIIKGETGKIEFWIPDEEKDVVIEYKIDQVKFCFDFVTELALKHNE
jgi:uncharacterized protein YutE (UPF0331/DUF86 family)